MGTGLSKVTVDDLRKKLATLPALRDNGTAGTLERAADRLHTRQEKGGLYGDLGRVA
jgi:hypothetical protein